MWGKSGLDSFRKASFGQVAVVVRLGRPLTTLARPVACACAVLAVVRRVLLAVSDLMLAHGTKALVDPHCVDDIDPELRVPGVLQLGTDTMAGFAARLGGDDVDVNLVTLLEPPVLSRLLISNVTSPR